MASFRFLQYGALAVVVLAAMILTPTGNAQTTPAPIEEMRLLIYWGDIDNKVDTVGDGTAVAWDGEITLSSGNMVVLRQLIFKDLNDRLLDREGATIRYQSDITSDMDGLFFRVFPTEGKNETITVTLKDGWTITQPISYFANNKETTFAVKDGLSLRMRAEAVVLKKTEPQPVSDQVLKEEIARCTAMKSLSECTEEVLTARGLDAESKHKFWQSLVEQIKKIKTPNASVGKINPDALLIMTEEELRGLTRQELSMIDLSKLSTINSKTYQTLLSLVPERVGELSPTVRERANALEGMVASTTLSIANLNEEEYQRFKRFLLSLNPAERTRFVEFFNGLSPASWDSLKKIDDELILSLGRIVFMTPENKREAAVKAYLRQAEKINLLKIKLEQLRSRLSLDQAKTLENLLTRLQDTLLWTGNDTPMILTYLDNFLGRTGALGRDDLNKALKDVEKEVNQALAENRVGLMKENLGLFHDVPSSAWYGGFVGIARDEGLLEGYRDKDGKLTGLFGPDNNITVAELLKITLNTTGNGNLETAAKLPAAKDHWAEGYVARAEELKLSLVADATLDLNRHATRGEVVQAFIEAYGITPPAITKTSFSDVTLLMPSARYIEFAKSHGIISGDAGKNTFRPNEKINRAEVTKIASLMFEYFTTLFESGGAQ